MLEFSEYREKKWGGYPIFNSKKERYTQRNKNPLLAQHSGWMKSLRGVGFKRIRRDIPFFSPIQPGFLITKKEEKEYPFKTIEVKYIIEDLNDILKRVEESFGNILIFEPCFYELKNRLNSIIEESELVEEPFIEIIQTLYDSVKRIDNPMKLNKTQLKTIRDVLEILSSKKLSEDDILKCDRILEDSGLNSIPSVDLSKDLKQVLKEIGESL
ncbi:MAG: hypothetical protein COS84_00440 [Armatimonadetes bacterium CG07_land_8_20_14_0_80_40_9]|nr:MAG: hypothetical protein COS84_00440 [Armatimonadetes bacterium CG07_land_8_20_14_0_80_40_9]